MWTDGAAGTGQQRQGPFALAAARVCCHVAAGQSNAVARHEKAWSSGSLHGRLPWHRPRPGQQSSYHGETTGGLRRGATTGVRQSKGAAATHRSLRRLPGLSPSLSSLCRSRGCGRSRAISARAKWRARSTKDAEPRGSGAHMCFPRHSGWRWHGASWPVHSHVWVGRPERRLRVWRGGRKRQWLGSRSSVGRICGVSESLSEASRKRLGSLPLESRAVSSDVLGERPYLATSPHISAHLPRSPQISPYLALSSQKPLKVSRSPW